MSLTLTPEKDRRGDDKVSTKSLPEKAGCLTLVYAVEVDLGLGNGETMDDALSKRGFGVAVWLTRLDPIHHSIPHFGIWILLCPLPRAEGCFVAPGPWLGVSPEERCDIDAPHRRAGIAAWLYLFCTGTSTCIEAVVWLYRIAGGHLGKVPCHY